MTMTTPNTHAPAAAPGLCSQCRQRRPLFQHVQRVVGATVHTDCEHCQGHDVHQSTESWLCSYCYRDAPALIDLGEERL